MRFAPAVVAAVVVAGAACGSDAVTKLPPANADGGAAGGAAPSTSGSARPAVPAPAGAENEAFGSNVALALDASGRAILAYFVESSAGGGDPDTDPLTFQTSLFVAREAADGSFGEPTLVDDGVGAVDHSSDQAYRQIGVSARGDEVVVVYVRAKKGDAGGDELWLASARGGAFTKSKIADDDARIANPVVNVGSSGTAVAYWSQSARGGFGGVLASIDGAKTSFTAVATLANDVVREPIAIGRASTGDVGIAFIESADPYHDGVVYVGKDGAAIAVADSQGFGTSSPSVGVAFAATTAFVSFGLNREAVPTADVWVASSSDGRTFGAPVPVPRDGGDVTGLFHSLAIDANGQPAVAAAVIATDPQKPGAYGAPKLARTTDGTTFTVGAPNGTHAASGVGSYVTLAAGPDGRLVMTFEDGDGAVGPPGIFLYRE